LFLYLHGLRDRAKRFLKGTILYLPITPLRPGKTRIIFTFWFVSDFETDFATTGSIFV
jgi:hypothetical protein